jgi:hypothetical protein
VYTELIAEKENSLLIPGATSSNGIACQPLYAPLAAGDPAAAHDRCMANKYCRVCARLTNLVVNLTRLRDAGRWPRSFPSIGTAPDPSVSAVDKALLLRDKCIRDHLFYRRPEDAGLH